MADKPKSKYYKGDKELHFELMRFMRTYGLKGKKLEEVHAIRDEIASGRLKLKPVIKGKNADSIAKRRVDHKKGIRYIVREVVENMPHVMECAYSKANDNFFIQYLYCQTDLTKRELGEIFGFGSTVIENKIKRFKWKKLPNLSRIQSVGNLIQILYKDPGDTIVVPEVESLEDVDERYRKDFYKIGVRIRQSLNQAVPDEKYIKSLKEASFALKASYELEREVNGKLSAKDERLVAVKEGEHELNKKKFDGGYGDITVVEMGENYDRDTQAILFLLKETLGEKGLDIEKRDEVLGSLIAKMTKKGMVDDDED